MGILERGQKGMMDGAAWGQGEKFEGDCSAPGEVIRTEGTFRRDKICRPGGEAKKSQSP